MSRLRSRPAWRALEKHYAEVRGLHLRDLFAEDPERGERLVAEGVGLYLDYSKNLEAAHIASAAAGLIEQSERAPRSGERVAR
jgi:hypothetical protein